MLDTGEEAKLACGNIQLCAGLEAGIEASLHAVREVWEDDNFVQPDRADPNDPFAKVVARMEEAKRFRLDVCEPGEVEACPNLSAEGVLLVDATNGFNELNRYCMLWNVRHLWPKGSRLAFNSYRHFNICVVRKGTGVPFFEISGEEGLSQGDPLAMALYGVALTPLAEHLRRNVPEVLTPWYADDAAGAGLVDGCAEALRFLIEYGPNYGYYPEPEKSYFICTKAQEAQAKAAFYLKGLKVQFARGKRYLGGFIGGEDHKLEWVEENR